MAKPPTFEPYPSPPNGWCLSVPPSMTASGKRARKFFKTEAAARKAAAKLRAAHRLGVRGSALPVEVAMQAVEALRILEGSGMSLVEAARVALGNQGKGRNAGRAGERFSARLDRVLAEGETVWSRVYADQMGRIPKWIGTGGMRSMCAELTEARVEELLTEAGLANSKGGISRDTLRMRKARIMAVLGQRVMSRGKRRRADIRILTRAEVTAMFAAATTDAQRWALGLLVYAGLRPDADHGEISRLDWASVTALHVYVPPKEAKTGTDRYVPMTPALAEALAGHPAEGPVRPPNWKREWTRIRKAAGISGHADIARHTFASHFLAWGEGGEQKTKMAMGHTANSDTLMRHYRRAVTAEDAAAFFAGMVVEQLENPE